MPQSYLIVHAQKQKRDAYIHDTLEKRAVNAVDRNILEGTIGIAQIRELLKKMSRKPFVSHYKAAVIEIEHLSLEAQQTLLKSLEEPTASSLFFLSTPNHNLMLQTIESRCTVIDLPVDSGQLLPKDLEKLSGFWQLFLRQKLGERFLSIAAVAATRDEACNWLTAQISYLTQELRNSYETPGTALQSGPQLAHLLKLLITARDRTIRNGSLKLALDQICIYTPFA